MGWREGIVVYKRNLHPSNIKTSFMFGLLMIMLNDLEYTQFRIFEAKYDVNSIFFWIIQATDCFRASMLDEWHVHLYTIVFSFSLFMGLVRWWDKKLKLRWQPTLDVPCISWLTIVIKELRKVGLIQSLIVND